MLRKIFDFLKRFIRRGKVSEIKPPASVDTIHRKTHRANKRKKNLRKIAELSRKKNRRKK